MEHVLQLVLKQHTLQFKIIQIIRTLITIATIVTKDVIFFITYNLSKGKDCKIRSDNGNLICGACLSGYYLLKESCATTCPDGTLFSKYKTY